MVVLNPNMILLLQSMNILKFHVVTLIAFISEKNKLFLHKNYKNYGII